VPWRKRAEEKVGGEKGKWAKKGLNTLIFG
jgi:hypothetical protein